MPCKHPGKPGFDYAFEGKLMCWVAWCPRCGEEWQGETTEPDAVKAEWVVE